MKPNVLLSIDPGLRGCGAAVFLDGKLLRAEYVKNTAPEDLNGPRAWALMAVSVLCWATALLNDAIPPTALLSTVWPIDRLAVEMPQTYGGRAKKGDANDLLPLAGVDAALAALLPYADVDYKVPHGWKGGIEKPKKAADAYIIKDRVIARLSPAELVQTVWPGNKRHGWDVADGIGVGLAALGRFERKRIYAVE